MIVDLLVDALQTISRWSIPLVVVAIPLYAHLRGVKVYESFVVGAEEGVRTAIRILPYLITMWVAIAITRASGLLDTLLSLCRPVMEALRIPTEIVPLALIRPLSGSGGLSVMTDLLHAHGPDSPIGLLASIVQGSTETTFYVLTVYLGAVGIRKARHAAVAGIAGDIAGFIGAVVIWRLMFA